jgi:peroxiredoxin
MKQVLLACLLCSAFLQSVVIAQTKEASMPKVGDLAPDFKMSYFDGKDLKEVTLSQYRGQKQVVLAFYVFAFTGG